MPRRLPRPDLERVFLELPRDERRTIAAWMETLGLPHERGWMVIPALADLLLLVVAARLAARKTGPRSAADRLSEALEELGVSDDADRASRPADAVRRRFRRWHAEARGRADIDVHASTGVVASSSGEGRTAGSADE